MNVKQVKKKERIFAKKGEKQSETRLETTKKSFFFPNNQQCEEKRVKCKSWLTGNAEIDVVGGRF